MTKLIVIVGITGNQGGSVAHRFHSDPAYRIRGLTRDPSSAVAKKLSSAGIEIVQANLDDVSSLIKAFEGANLIFSVTNYWEPFFRPDSRAAASTQGISCRRYAYDVELQQGKNIADAAAAVVSGLDDNGFIASTLSHAGKCSGGKFKELYHFDAKADVFPFYVKEKHPELEKKMSCVQTGYFMSSWKLAPGAYFAKQDDGSFVMSFPTSPEAKVQHFAVNRDMGNFVYAVSKRAPGGEYMAAGETCTWPVFLGKWCEVTGKKARYQEITLEQFMEASPDKEFGREVGDMFAYSTEPGYDGGMKLVYAEELEKVCACFTSCDVELMIILGWRGVSDDDFGGVF
jgi:hypothetical protein